MKGVMDLPSFYRIRQRFDAASFSDVAASVRSEFSKSDLTSNSHGKWHRNRHGWGSFSTLYVEPLAQTWFIYEFH